MKKTGFSSYKKHFFLLFFIFVSFFLWSEKSTIYPLIKDLQHKDPVFLQYSDDVELARRALALEKDIFSLPIKIYKYKVKPSDSILTISARCSIPYDAIISLNRISSIEEKIEGRELLLPTLPAIYLPDNATTSLEILIFSFYKTNPRSSLNFYVYYEKNSKKKITCYPNAILEGTTRNFFLTPSFVLPLAKSVLTSNYGLRKNPITGNTVFHNGIDLAAPEGTDVYPCAEGTVKETGYSPIYGNYIIISHANNKESLYGHLSKIKIELREKVKSSTILGKVGSTGQSTGPHLHFEIREHGQSINPLNYIKGN